MNSSPNLPGYALIVTGCWLIFLGYWLVSAFKVKATAERKSFASSLAYRIPFIIGAIMIGTFGWHYPMTLSLTPDTEATRWAGAFVCVAGLGVTIWARATLGSNWSSNVQFKEGHQLVKTGPYRFARHPIYTGILIMCTAQGIQFGRLHFWLGWLIVFIGLWIKLKQEEAVMLRHFPEYADYRKQVKAIVPFVI
jgi:protein-S-isoprenylcysteine O-methyltransferase Ste14